VGRSRRAATVEQVSTTTGTRRSRLAAFGAARPWLLDVGIVAVIVVIGTLPAADRSGGDLGRLFTVALALPLLLRRRYPRAVFAVVAAVALAQWFADVRAFGDIALLIALYTVASTQPRRITVLAAAVIEVGAIMAAGRFAHHNWLTAFVGLSGLCTAAGVLGANVRNRRALVVSLHERAARLEHERDQQGRLAAAAERARIAREMHDVVAHNLSVMIALADGATYALADAPERAEAAMRTASRTGRQALNEMRRLLGVLRDASGPQELAPQPGIEEIGELVDQVRSAGLPVRYDVAGRPSGAVPPGLALAAYRIVQEALTNVLKHAGPGADAHVSLSFEDDAVCIDVVNSGGHVAAPAAEGGGLRGMRERAAVYDGVLDAGPDERGGWRVRARLLHDVAPDRVLT
jgi:signal transduction histidine kinase